MGNKISPEEEIERIFNNAIDPSQYEALKCLDLEVENLVFEGSGAKSIVYTGVAKALYDLGILQKCKRFAGSSAGSMFSAMLAFGMTPEDILKVQRKNLKPIFQDTNYCCLLPNILGKYGWIPGDKALKLFKDLAEEYTGNPDITFMELYKLRGVELCYTITNVTTGTLEHFHPKTTPDFPIPLATRIAICLPLIFQPVVVHRPVLIGEEKTYLVDGGMTDNFPLNCFDGWYLSMKPDDSFFHKLGTDRPRFDEFNKKTLGVLVFDAFEHDVYLEEFMERLNWLEQLERPVSKLSQCSGPEGIALFFTTHRKRSKKVDDAMAHKLSKAKLRADVTEFLDVLKTRNLTRDGAIPVPEFKAALEKLPTETMNALFGFREKNRFHTASEFVQKLDKNKDGEITYAEFLEYCSHRCIRLQEVMRSISISKPLNSLYEFSLASIYQAGDMEKRRIKAKSEDSGRIIGVYTDYLNTLDFDLSLEDKIHGIRLGWNAAIAFLRTKSTSAKK